MIELRTHDGFPGASLRAEWELLVDEDPHATIFHTPRYLQVWADTLGGGVVRVDTVHRDGRLIGVIPLSRERVGGPTGPMEVLRFLGGTDVTDYLGPVSRLEDRDDVAGAYVDALAERRDWDEVVAGGLAADSGWREALVRHVRTRGLEIVDEAVDDVCPRISLTDGYDEYLKTLGSKQRHELRRKARKLARDAGEVNLVAVPAEHHQQALDSFFAMAAEVDGEKGRFFLSDEMRAFFGALADEFGPDGTFRIHALEVAGAVGAATISLVHKARWGLYNSTFDVGLRNLAPGMVLVGELIRAAAEEKLAVFDLLRGDEPYKYRFGADDRTLRRVALSRG